jgi:malate dehydrogenase (oxaloacetate-decarboxylating)
MAWTDERAVIGTGSPFPPVMRHGKPMAVDQTNNAYIFPGVGLGVLAMNASRVTDSMFMAAAKALAGASPAARDPEDTLLPSVSRLREVAEVVGNAVAKQAQLDGVADPSHAHDDDRQVADAVRSTMWQPVYKPYKRVRWGSGYPERRACGTAIENKR